MFPIVPIVQGVSATQDALVVDRWHGIRVLHMGLKANEHTGRFIGDGEGIH
jgi:hypothetical protein